MIKVTRYDKSIVDIDFIKKTSSVKVEEIDEKNNSIINKEIKVYTEEDHLNRLPYNIQKLYETLKNKILELDDIDVDVKKVYIAFKGITNIVDIDLSKKKIRVTINMKKGTLIDPGKFAKDISKIGHWGNGDYRAEIYNVDDIDKVIPLVKQSLNINKK